MSYVDNDYNWINKLQIVSKYESLWLLLNLIYISSNKDII